MTAPFPDNAWLTYAEATARWGVQTNKRQAEYIRRSPEVLAADESVKALVAAAYEAGAKAVKKRWWGGTHWIDDNSDADRIRALTPADAASALTRLLAEARVAERDRLAAMFQAQCPKCGGEGWLWGHELDDYEHPHPGQADGTKYTCDGAGCSHARATKGAALIAGAEARAEKGEG
jgi:hypothetical protein